MIHDRMRDGWGQHYGHFRRGGKKSYEQGAEGPLVVHMSSMCHLSWRIAQGGHLCFSIGPKITKLVEDIEYIFLYLLRVRFH